MDGYEVIVQRGGVMYSETITSSTLGKIAYRDQAQKVFEQNLVYDLQYSFVQRNVLLY